MRYIIIPLLIVLYIYWTFKSVIDISHNGAKFHEYDWYSMLYTIVHCVVVAYLLIILTIIYW